MVSGAKTRFSWHIHASYAGDRELMAVEVRPQIGGVMNWRFAVPTATTLTAWGLMQTGSGRVKPPKRALVESKKAVLGNREVLLYGAADRLSEGMAACVVFRKEAMPPFVAFGVEEVTDHPGACTMERITFVLPGEEMRPAEEGT
ncbi:MAG: hypothetical protein GXX83_06425 [Gaiellales bacterium]|nr:hypothetical protein [Gaiellales bacterium]